ncbi:MAG: DUF885 domain-containing protein [Phenylobacterium sp.]|uniref:DUF885 domain-containing protein n=1 Tax=Phenylobacterium sp. TaxID=1871053 RepID=UPI00391AAE28
MRLLFAALLAGLLALSAPARADDLATVIADYDAFQAWSDPLWSAPPEDREALARLPDVTPAADARRAQTLADLQRRLEALPAAGLDPEARLNRDVLSWLIAAEREQLAFDIARMPFSSDGGFHTTFVYLPHRAPMTSRADVAAWIARLEAAPGFWRDHIANARRGVASGFVQPRTTVEPVLAQAREMAAAPVEGDAALAPFDRLPDALSAQEKAQARARGIAAVAELRQAQAEFAAFLETEYLPAARDGLAARDLPDGARFYAAEVRRHTTTDLTPEEIHQVGLSEVARIRGEMVAIKDEVGFEGDLAAFIASLRADPKFHAQSREALLEKASEIAKRIDGELPAWFATLPRLPYGVRPVPAQIEAGYTTGRYLQGDPERGVAGTYLVNTSALDQRPLYELPALTLHEAVPGHHLQIALAQELEAVPDFRRQAGMSAFVEGWGLYAEKLGGEMGVYRDPYERFGRLSYEMWRACRLVADTGLHWKRWSLDQARACFAENTALSPLNIEVELARYVSWPGQALAYKVGELKIVELREQARAELGEAFDIRRFHDAVLLAGALPLDLLEARIEAWIAAETPD